MLTEKLEMGWDIQRDGRMWKVYDNDVFEKVVDEITYNVKTSSKNILNNPLNTKVINTNHNILSIEQIKPPQKEKEMVLLAEH
jgi:hypothetical protein